MISLRDQWIERKCKNLLDLLKKKRKFEHKYTNNKNYHKVKSHRHYLWLFAMD